MSAVDPLCPADIGIILSYQCQLACRHCVYNSGPAWQDWITPAELRHAFMVLSNLPESLQVHLTGGEPFLNYSLLLQSVEIAESFGIPCYVETNADWCTQPDVVMDRLIGLKQAGLDAVLISCTPYHAEKVPLTRTLLAIDAALQVFGPRGVLVFLPEWIDHLWRFGTRTPIPINRFIQAYGLQPASVMLWDSFEMASGGRAGYHLGFLTTLCPASSFRHERCLEEILFPSHLHFDLYGNVIPNYCAGISIGDWHEFPDIRKRFARQEVPALIDALITAGPYALFKIAHHDFGFIERPSGYAGKCHLCVDVRRYLARWPELFPELRPLGFYSGLEPAGSPS